MRLSRVFQILTLLLLCTTTLAARSYDPELRIERLRRVAANRYFADARGFKFVSHSPQGTLAGTEFELSYVSSTASVWDAHQSGFFTRRYQLTSVHIRRDRKIVFVGTYIPAPGEFLPVDIAVSNRMIVVEDQDTHELTIRVEHVFAMCTVVGQLTLATETVATRSRSRVRTPVLLRGM